MSVRIICIKKDGGNHYNPYEAISEFGWIEEPTNKSGIVNLPEMIKFLEEDKGEAYVINRFDPSDRAYLYVNQRNGKKFVQTYADGQWNDNLLQLPECK